jgi:signal transduction histidine kinase
MMIVSIFAALLIPRMKQVTIYSIFAALAILVLQGFWIYQMRQWYVGDFGIKAEESFAQAIEQEVSVRTMKIANPKQKWYLHKPVAEMSPHERSKYKGDTLDLSILEKQGAARSYPELISQIMQDRYIGNGMPPVLHKLDSLFVLCMDKTPVSAHCILFCKEGNIRESYGKTSLIGHDNRVLNFDKPIGTKGTYHLQLLIEHPTSAVLSRMTHAILGSLVLVLLVVLVLNYQLAVIRRRNRELAQHEVSVKGTIHELKSPLAGVVTLLNWLVNKEKDPAMLPLIRKGAEQLRALGSEIEALLESVKDGERNISLSRAEVDLPALVRTVADKLSIEFVGKRYHIEVVDRLEKHVPVLDGEYMQVVLRNLIENALKYSDDGVTVTVTLERFDRDRQLRLSVADTGWGIGKRDLKQLFRTYYRVPREAARSRKGHGIGLMYVASIVRAHGGAVKVVSRENVGSTFILTLPMNEPAHL